MTSTRAPRGVLYVLTNEKMLRFDLETKETSELFSNLPWVPPARYFHLTYLKHLGKVGFFDSEYDYGIAGERRRTVFLVAHPATGETQVMFDFKRGVGLGGLSYSPNEDWFAFLDSPPRPENEPIKLGERAPSLPPDQLWLRNFSLRDEILLAEDASPPGPPPVWLSDKSLVYLNYSNELVQINIETKKKEPWGIFNVLPWALSPNGKQLLCTDEDYSSIYLLDVDNRALKLVKKYGGRRVLDGNMVWSPDGRSFIFNRTILRDHLLPRFLWGETPERLYWHDLETGREERLSKDPWWKDPAEDPWLYSGAVWFAEDPFQVK